MAQAERRIEVKIIGDEKDLLRAFRASSKEARRFSVGVGTIIKSAVIFEGVRQGVRAMGDALRAGANEWSEQTRVAAQTNAVIKATSGVAKVTARDVKRLAGNIQGLSGIDDEAIQSASNLILTFKAVRNELGRGNRIFDRATKAAVDLSVAGFGSISSTAKQMGKALQDPVRGLTALRRSGVTFTKAQEALIRKLVDTGQILRAQKVILREVETQVGGSAKALGDTLPGQLNKLRESVRNTFGDLVARAAPALANVLGGVNDFIKRLSKARTAKARLRIVFDTGRDLVRQGLVIAERVRARVGEALAAIDWRQVGARVGEGLTRALGAISDSISRVDWGQVGQAVVRGISEFLKGVDWVTVLRVTATLLVRAIIGLHKLVFAASKELGRQLLLGVRAGVTALGGVVVDAVRALPRQLSRLENYFADQVKGLGTAIMGGIGRGLDSAKDAIIRRLLQFINRILGVTGFLGKFDPFKGVRERVQRRLQDMEGDTRKSIGNIQGRINTLKGKDVSIRVSADGVRETQAAIDGIRGKSVLIEVRTKVENVAKGFGGLAIGAQDQLATQGDNALGKALVTRANRQANSLADAAKQAAAARRRAAALVKQQAAAAAKALEEAKTAFANLLGGLDLAQLRAEATKGLADDLRVAKQREAAIRDQIAIEGRTTDLLTQLFQIEQRQAEILRERNQARAAARKSNQFKALGLTAEGAERTPGAGSLLKRTQNLTNQIKGTFLDTGKTRGQLAQIAKVLSGAFGKVGKDVRAAILAMLNDIASALQGGQGQKGPLTKFRVKNVSNMFGDLGLSEQQLRDVRRQATKIGAGGVATVGNKRGGAFGLVPVGGGGAVNYNFNAPLTIVANDTDQFRKDLERRTRRTARSRTGPGAGSRGAQ